MPYVSRSADGMITGLFEDTKEGAREYIDADAPEVAEFIQNVGEQVEEHSEVIQQELAQSDMEMIRVLEDLIATLIDKRVIMMTDLPKAAQRKLATRYSLRSKLTDLGNIVGDNDEILLP
ncbi:hypothetical protein [Kiloniella laminariae]|uniref:hypothetical protein n=1 Tax=Kiloniella laminariae TaxID=454162 RepID=UPI00037A2169|nr:hypothetical protein [Kiloniella laminariae]